MDILYHDSDIVVAIKPRGVLSEERVGEETMPALLKQALGGELFTVHRLDRPVGGVMVYARNKRAAAALSAAVQSGALQKEYTAIVTGAPKEDEATLSDHLYHDARTNKTFVVDRARKGAKEACLSYRVLDKKCQNGVDFTQISVQLHTGRSHQIRVQLAFRQMPLVGDGKYGSRQKAAFLALTATKLSFPHPKTGKSMAFQAPTPSDFPWDIFTESHFEIERRFLIEYPDVALLTAQEGCRIKRITQTYLTAADRETRRVREVREGGATRYIYTVKKRVSMIRAVEEEGELTAAAYEALLTEADSTRRAIHKTRYCIPYEGHVIEVDVLALWQDQALCEVELKDEREAFSIPPYLKIIREVTSDPAYKNVNLAKK